MKPEPQISIPETIVAVLTLAAATLASYSGAISGDALVALYGSVLGYVFGRVRNGTENSNGGIRSTPSLTRSPDTPPFNVQEAETRAGEGHTPYVPPGTGSE